MNTKEPKETLEAVIIGAGFSGLGMAIRLKQAGIDSFVILERGDGVGGVWRDNTYPGCACDVESLLYSFSFAPNTEWSNLYANRDEIRKYLEGVAQRFDLLRHLRVRTPLVSARWDDKARLWRVTTPEGELTSRFLVSAAGALNEPLVPKIPGLESFRGRMFHSAEWDHGYALDDKRVAVIGTGASAIQFVPQIQKQVAQLTLFQRTPAWILPRRDKLVDENTKRRFRRIPLYQKLRRLRVYLRLELFGLGFRKQKHLVKAKAVALRHLAKRVPDPVLRAKLTPSYVFGCKRVLLSDDYYPALVKPNVEVVTEAIREVREGGVVTADGREHAVDAIILGTGFHVTDFTIAARILGPDGRSLQELWREQPTAYCGTVVPGFPNFFFLLGPNTALGHNSVLLMVEAQIELAMKAIRYLKRRRLGALDVKTDRAEEYARWMEEKSKTTVWLSGCKSWYLDASGRNATIWPLSVGAFRRRARAFRAGDYHHLENVT